MLILKLDLLSHLLFSGCKIRLHPSSFSFLLSLPTSFPFGWTTMWRGSLPLLRCSWVCSHYRPMVLSMSGPWLPGKGKHGTQRSCKHFLWNQQFSLEIQRSNYLTLRGCYAPYTTYCFILCECLTIMVFFKEGLVLGCQLALKILSSSNSSSYAHALLLLLPCVLWMHFIYHSSFWDVPPASSHTVALTHYGVYMQTISMIQP